MIDGLTFDSIAEAARWLILKDLLAAGKISWLRRQVRFWLHAQGGEKVARYVADFVYIEAGRQVVEDVKSPRTATLETFRLKCRWMKAEYGIEVKVEMASKKGGR